MKKSWQRGVWNDEHSGYWVIWNKHGYYFRRGGMETGNPACATGYFEQHRAKAACRLKNKQEPAAQWEPVLIDDACEDYDNQLVEAEKWR